MSGVTCIGARAFGECENFENVTIPDGLTNIGRMAFVDCASLKSILIPRGVTKIDEKTFHKCPSLSIRCENNSYAHTYATKVKIRTVVLCGDDATWTLDSEGTLNVTGAGAMYDYTIDTVVNGIRTVRIECTPWYGEIDNIKTVNVEGVTYIGSDAFKNCAKLESVNISDSVTTIGKRGFACCPMLKRVMISESVTSIGNNAFVRCGQFTIYGVLGSYAQKYAEENGIPFLVSEMRR